MSKRDFMLKHVVDNYNKVSTVHLWDDEYETRVDISGQEPLDYRTNSKEEATNKHNQMVGKFTELCEAYSEYDKAYEADRKTYAKAIDKVDKAYDKTKEASLAAFGRKLNELGI